MYFLILLTDDNKVYFLICCFLVGPYFLVLLTDDNKVYFLLFFFVGLYFIWISKEQKHRVMEAPKTPE